MRQVGFVPLRIYWSFRENIWYRKKAVVKFVCLYVLLETLRLKDNYREHILVTCFWNRRYGAGLLWCLKHIVFLRLVYLDVDRRIMIGREGMNWIHLADRDKWCGFLWIDYWSSGFHTMRGVSWLAGEVVAITKDLASTVSCCLWFLELYLSLKYFEENYAWFQSSAGK